MKKRIYRNILTLAAFALILILGVCVSFFGNSFRSQTRTELAAEAAFVSKACEEAGDGTAFCEGMGKIGDIRLTLISPDGTVLYDSDASASDMENHLKRPEVAEAFEDGSGSASRLSSTMDSVTYYEAVRLSDGNVLRLCMKRTSIFQIFLQMLPLLAAVAAILLLTALLSARTLTGKIVSAINDIDLKHPSKTIVFPELEPLLNRMDTQNEQLKQQMSDLLEQERKFQIITTNMNEGLILLDASEKIVFMNQSLKESLGAGKMDYTGKHISLFHRSAQMSEVIQNAQKGKARDAVITFYERKFHIYGNPVFENSKITGVVLFFVDISEKERAEQMRREFTANVSHELKTPLTSISGYAEMIQNQMVQPKDIPVFAGKIYDEAGRLLVLINDIIKLSRMDEGQNIQPKEVVDLAEISQDIYTRLLPVAEKKTVTFEMEISKVQVLAVRPMIYDMIYNLCENAIKYNKEQGHVMLEVFEKEERPIIRVTDTGIGIPAKHQERIFERFYRVDKSHSRQTGGTGLGLAIVKHVVEYHGGYIEIHSREGIGTVITIHL